MEGLVLIVLAYGALAALVRIAEVAGAVASRRRVEREIARRHRNSATGKTRLREIASVDVQTPAVSAVQPREAASSRSEASGGLLYLVQSQRLNALKIGVSSHTSSQDRVQAHLDNGWTLAHCWNFDDLRIAERVEGAVKAWIRNDLGLPPACGPNEMPQGGYTETVSRAGLELDRLYDFTQQLTRRASATEALSANIDSLIVGATMRVKGQLVAVRSKSREARFEGTYRWHSKRHPWQQWFIEDETGLLLAEMSSGNLVSSRELRLGRTIEVVGRVQQVRVTTPHSSSDERIYRMTNPIYRLEEMRLWFGRVLQARQTAERATSKLSVTARTRRGGRAGEVKIGTAIAKGRSRGHAIGFARAGDNYISAARAVAADLQAERCSSCGRLVPNGAAHDC